MSEEKDTVKSKIIQLSVTVVADREISEHDVADKLIGAMADQDVNTIAVPTKQIIDRESKIEAIGFAEFLKDNSYTKSENGWYQYYTQIENFPTGFSMSIPVYTFLTIEEIYQLYKKESK